MVPLRRAALAEAVDVGDRAEIVELMVRGDFRRFPDGSFRALAVAEQHVRAVVGFDSARVERDADRPPQRPCPSDPVATSTNGSRGVGWPSRSDVILRRLQQISRAETRRPRPTRRRGSARRDPSTARSDPLRDAADRADRSASRRRRAPRRSPPPTYTSSDGRSRLPTSSARNRCGAAWRGCGEQDKRWCGHRMARRVYCTR